MEIHDIGSVQQMLPALCFVDIKTNNPWCGLLRSVWSGSSGEARCCLEACNVATTQLFSSRFFAAVRGGLQSLAAEQHLKRLRLTGNTGGVVGVGRG